MSQELQDRLLSVGKGALIAAAGVALTYITGALSGIDFGGYTPIVVGLWSVFVQAARKGLEHLGDTALPSDIEK